MVRLRREPIWGSRSILSLAVCLPNFAHLTPGLNGPSTPYPRDVRRIARTQYHTNIGNERTTFCTPEEVAQSVNSKLVLNEVQEASAGNGRIMARELVA